MIFLVRIFALLYSIVRDIFTIRHKRERPEKVRFPDSESLMTKERVGDGYVEHKIWDRVREKVSSSLHMYTREPRESSFTLLSSDEVLLFHGLEIYYRLLDTDDELRERLLFVRI